MIYCFDVDNTLCTTDGNNYGDSVPDKEMIGLVNRLYDEGNYIKIFTARGAVSGVDHTTLTDKQLRGWGLKFHELIMNKKPHFDLLVDDKCINVNKWKSDNALKKRGFLCGAFDLIHPGYARMWKDAKSVCDYLIVGLQTDPTIDRPTKEAPVHSIEERKSILESIKYIDEIVVYETEKDLYELLKRTSPDIRILGSDYRNADYNGCDLGIPVYFHERDHNWSATNLRNKIRNMEVKI